MPDCWPPGWSSCSPATSTRADRVLGPLQEHLDDPDVLEVMVTAGRDIWTESRDGMRRVGTVTPEQLAVCVERIARMAGRRIDVASPVLDARLSDGSRACVVLAPVSVGGTTVNIRKFPRRILPLAAFGPAHVTDRVRGLVANRANVVVSGATSSGKTSLLSAVSAHFHPLDRVVVAEDTHELRMHGTNVVHLQTRAATVEGIGRITLQDLVRTSLRLRPDRLVVGEVRGSEAVDMLLALGTGHRGCWSTVHAASAGDTVARLVAMVVRDAPQWSADHVRDLVTSAIDAVVHVRRGPDGRRGIVDVVELRA